jgi:hypothetical protein
MPRVVAAYDLRMPATPSEPDATTPDATPEAAGSREAPPQMPSRTAFLLAFVSIAVAGIFGGIIGYGLVDVSTSSESDGAKLLGTLIGSTLAAGGVGIVAVLVLRAMAEWKVKTR